MTRAGKRKTASRNEPLLGTQSVQVKAKELPSVALRDRARERPDTRPDPEFQGVKFQKLQLDNLTDFEKC